MIQSFLTGRTQRVVLSTSKSDWNNLYQGVPQRTVLGPLLFNLYVNGMQNNLAENSNLVQFADDTLAKRVVLSTNKSDWIKLYQCVPQRTVLGQLLFNLYVNSMLNNLAEYLNLVQYADDTLTKRVVLSTNKSDWIQLYQCVPQRTVLGQLRFNLYVNSMLNNLSENSKLVQCADDTFVFVAANCINTGIINLQRILEKLIVYFELHQLNINAKKQSLLVSVNHRKTLQ